MTGNFERSKSLNQAAAHASGKILFFIDVDAIVPAGFDKLLTNKISNGVSFFPICYSLFRDKPPEIAGNNGWWRHEGFGFCGFTKSDFSHLLWNEKYKKWGGEDDDIYKRANRKLKVIRERCPGLYHIWHGKNRQ